jgi:tripartite-type tricarboxylate transporter receptor subunit TctC
MGEAGGPDLDIVSWYGVWGPKGLPDPVTQRLSKTLEQMVASEAYVTRLKELGITPRYKDMNTFKTFIEAEAKWGIELLQAVNVKQTEKQ